MTEDETAPPTAPRRWRPWVRRIGLGVGAFLLFFVLIAVGLRLYFDDEYIRTRAETIGTERLGTSVQIRSLDIALFSGATLEGIRIAPPNGFELDVLAIEKVSVGYDLWALLGGTVHVTRFDVHRVDVAYEENESGQQNISVLLANLSPDDRPPAPPSGTEPATKEKPEPPRLPELPFDVVVDRVGFGPLRARAQQPDLEFEIDRVAFEANARISGGAGYAL
ncbi:MAG: hypothetical protein AAF658_04475, partial [Myxococcota bacterium]